MKGLFIPKRLQNLRLALMAGIGAGFLTAILVLTLGKGTNPYVWNVANFLGGLGNDLFLVSTNLLIIGWALRRNLKSLIKLILGLDLTVWIVVQAIKLFPVAAWALRPDGTIGGFPSGHTTHAFAMGFVLTLLFPRFWWFWYSCSMAISWSRVESSWHTDMQVIAGIFLGLGIAWVLISLWSKHPDADRMPGQGRVPYRRPERSWPYGWLNRRNRELPQE
ncbi:phosphatase PAP2 family protein [Acetonema longum]|uniref:Phosphatidic acid phosphatase type 2/haloperoxidase domain-containing protein n=1 Tax=Acetonema longum DSM 6540 TaxID=1009370 RepID=F7NKI7_9FIRM|nr:phosphatase PAP2 family protein [Acetonema longum]EGO63439.1 hypothetical protein ALO_13005 [Acetonema longum DSM 6540]